MLGKQQEVVDHCSELQVVVQPPHNHKTPQNRRAEHEDPFLDEEGNDASHDPHHQCDDDRNVDVISEEGDVDGGKDEPGQEEPDAAPSEEDTHVVDADSEQTCDGWNSG